MTKGNITVKILQKIILLDNQNRILILRRSNYSKTRANLWDLPGGKLEANEDPVAGIIREVKEETSLIIRDPKVIYICSGDAAIGGSEDSAHVIATCYFTKNWEGNTKISSEHLEYKWVTQSECNNLVFKDDGNFFQNSLNAYSQLAA